MYQFCLEKGSSNIYILIPDLNWLRADTESLAWAWAGGTEVQPGKQWTRRNASKLLQCPKSRILAQKQTQEYFLILSMLSM